MASLWWSVLLWGLGGMVAALLICGICIWLFARRPLREYQPQPAFTSALHASSRQRLNQLHHVLPARKGAPPPSIQAGQQTAEPRSDEEAAGQPSASSQELPWATVPKPPQWLIDAGVLKQDGSEHPPGMQQEP